MTVLLRVVYPDGTLAGCHKTCYNSKTKKCTCICGGRNHGVGLEQATRNTRYAMSHPEEHLFPEPPPDAILTFSGPKDLVHYTQHNFLDDIPDPDYHND